MKSNRFGILTILLLILLFTTEILLGQKPKWVAKDKRIITEIVANHDNPKAIEKIFPKEYRRPGSARLGFGYKILSKALYGGYITIYGEFLYKKDSLVGYVLRPGLPDKPKMRKKYLIWYNGKFAVGKGFDLEPYYFNKNAFEDPLETYQGEKSLNKEIRFYMSTESGLNYGGRGGYSMNLLKNREHFLDLKNELNRETVMELLYSKNPATRLTAIEYYYKNPEMFQNNQTEIENWIQMVFRQVPMILTFRGCIGLLECSKDLVEEYSKIRYPKD